MGFGTIKFGPRKREKIWARYTLLRFVLAMGGIAWGIYWMFQTSANFYYGLGGLLIYSVLGYVVHPEPDWQDMGCLGALFDNPFRISDNFNRILSVLLLCLLPARFISETFADFIEQILKPLFMAYE